MQQDRPCLNDDQVRLSTGIATKAPTSTASMVAAGVKLKRSTILHP